MSYKYAYLHGFAADPESEKARHFSSRFADVGHGLEMPDLNVPSFNELTYTAMVNAVDELDARTGGSEPWRFVASSLGGYTAARWAQLNPQRVDRLVLLSPGFDMRTRWPELLGERGMEEWEDEGSFLFFGPDDSLQPVHWELYADACRNHPPFPEVPCETLIIHGDDDPIVPVEYSRKYAEEYSGRVRFVEVEGEHTLESQLERLGEETMEFFGLDE